MKNLKTLMIGFIVGSMCTIATTAFAESEAIKFSIATNVKVTLDSVLKKMPTGRSPIIYNDDVYLPIGFISGTLGYLVDWNGVSGTVNIKTPKSKVSTTTTSGATNNTTTSKTTTNNVVTNNTTTSKTTTNNVVTNNTTTNNTATNNTTTNNTTTTDTRVYNQMPIMKTNGPLSVQVTSVSKDPDYTRVNLWVQNEPSGNAYNYQLEQSSAVIVVDGTEYPFSYTRDVDNKWYNDIKKGDELRGYIIFPAIPEDSKKMHFEIKARNNSSISEQEKILFDFDIKLN